MCSRFWAKIGHKRNVGETGRQKWSSGHTEVWKVGAGHALLQRLQIGQLWTCWLTPLHAAAAGPRSFCFSNSQVRCLLQPQLLLPDTCVIGIGNLEAEAGSRLSSLHGPVCPCYPPPHPSFLLNVLWCWLQAQQKQQPYRNTLTSSHNDIRSKLCNQCLISYQSQGFHFMTEFWLISTPFLLLIVIQLKGDNHSTNHGFIWLCSYHYHISAYGL